MPKGARRKPPMNRPNIREINRPAAGAASESGRLGDHAPDDIEGQESRPYTPDGRLFHIAFRICFVRIDCVANDIRHELHGCHDPEGYIGVQRPRRIRKAAEVLIDQHQPEQRRDDRGGRRYAHGHDPQHRAGHDPGCLVADAADPHSPDVAEQRVPKKQETREFVHDQQEQVTVEARNRHHFDALPAEERDRQGEGVQTHDDKKQAVTYQLVFVDTAGIRRYC